MISKQELKYILYSSLFAFVWFILLLPLILKNFSEIHPGLQLLFFNAGLFVFYSIFLKSFVISKKITLLCALGLTLLFLIPDLLQPEYHVTMTGELVKGGILGSSTIDYNSGLLAKSIGLDGILVYLFTYLLMPFILLFIVAKLLPNFVKSI